MTSIYLNRIRLENFGSFRNESFEIRHAVNFLGGGEDAAKILLQAIKVLLWPTLSESIGDLSTFTRDLTVTSKTGKHPSTITGNFKEFDDDLAPTGIQHSLSVILRATKGKGAVKFLWDEDPKSIAQVREQFATYGLHRASVFSLSEDTIASRLLVPMEFFRSKLNEIPLAQEVKKNIEKIGTRSQNLLEGLELYSLTSSVCQTTKRRMRNLLSPDSGNAELLNCQEELKELVKYSKHRELENKALRLEGTIQKFSKHLQREEKKERTKEAKRLAHFEALNPILAGMPAGISTPEGILDQLKQQLNQKSSQMAVINEKSLSWASSANEQPLRSLDNSSINPRVGRAPKSSLERALAREQREVVDIEEKILRCRIRRGRCEARLQIFQNSGGTERDTTCYQRALKETIEFSKRKRVSTEGDQRKLEETISQRQYQLWETMILKDATDERIIYKEKDLLSLEDSEMVESLAIAELRELMTSGSHFESLEYETMASLGANFVQLLQDMPPILEDIEIEADSEASTFGYFGTIIELIDVESEFRPLMRPLKNFLASHLVRDIGLAWRLQNAIKRFEVVGKVSVIGVDDYEAEEGLFQPPDGAERLSEFIKLKSGTRVASNEELCSKIQTIITNELRHYSFIGGDPAVARETADSLLKNPEWESCIFVTRDGRCFSVNEDSGPPTGAPGRENPIDAFESLCEYGTSLRSQISDRERGLERLKQARESCKSEHSELLKNSMGTENEAFYIQLEIDVLLSDQRFLASKISEIDSDIKDQRQQIVQLRQEQACDGGASQEAAMNDYLGRLSAEIEDLYQQKQRLQSSIIESLASLAQHLIAGTRYDRDRVKLDDLKCQVSVLESEIDSVEGFIERIHDDDIEKMEVEEAESPLERSQGSDAGIDGSELTHLRIKLFLLRRKLELVEEEISAGGNLRAPPNWVSGRDYADELDKLKKRSTTEEGYKVDGALRTKLVNATERAPETFSVTDKAMETLRRVVDLSREKTLLPDLGTDALESMIKRFEENFLELAPRGGVQVVDSVQTIAPRSDTEPSMGLGKRRKVNNDSGQPTVGQRDTVIKVSFNRAVSDLRIPRNLSGGETSILNISVLLSPTALSPPRMILLDEVDAPFDDSTQSRFEKFINKFRGGCQMFVVSHKAAHGSPKVDRQILLQADP